MYSSSQGLEHGKPSRQESKSRMGVATVAVAVTVAMNMAVMVPT
jgi:hypothetical protein